MSDSKAQEKDADGASCPSRCSTLQPDEFDHLLVRCGFNPHGSNWWVKESSGVGPIFNLRIAPKFGCDGCCVQQRTVYGNSVVDIRMPETEQEFRVLCLALGVELNA